MAHCYVFDLDGTLADLTHRLHYIQDVCILTPGNIHTADDCTMHDHEPKDWRGFFAACEFDTPIEPVRELYNALSGTCMVIVSGRSDECRKATIEWLWRNDLRYDALYMRREGDHRPDHKVKSELLDQLLIDGWEPLMFFDDRAAVVEMWRARGYTCAQVAEGRF